jgi:hypothetical protein
MHCKPISVHGCLSVQLGPGKRLSRLLLIKAPASCTYCRRLEATLHTAD